MTLQHHAQEIRRLSDALRSLPYSCPYARIAAKRLDAAWQALCEGCTDRAVALIEDALIHAGYAENAARIAGLRAAARAEANRPIA